VKHISDWLVAAAVTAAAAALLGRMVVKMIVWGNRTMKRLNLFLGEWLGDKDSGQPGFPARLAAVEQGVSSVDRIIREQLLHNGGSSLADQMTQVHRAVGADAGPVVRNGGAGGTT